MIHAPFNFVPLSKKVYFPEWAEQISHDIPFEDGESGEIEIKITAHSPIFVRNGHTKAEGESKADQYKSFSKVGNQYFIPATSIKGAIRNVLEIMSFAKLKTDNRTKFAVRDWENIDVFPLKDPAIQRTIKCGWLKYDEANKKYEITNCGEPYRINHLRIDEYLGGSILKSKFERNSSLNLNKPLKSDQNKDIDPKTALYKYKLLNSSKKITDLSFSLDEIYCTKYAKRRVKYDRTGNIKGTIVFTGQPDKWIFPRKPKGGKFYDFVFPEIKDQSRYEINFEYFKSIYKDSTYWELCKENLKNKQGIPVFFRLEKIKKDSGLEEIKIKDFGLAYMYKLPYEETPYELLNEEHKKNDKDLAECMFGTTTKEQSLKGRVHFSHAFTTNGKLDTEVSLVLSSPKASYYPMYIEQNGNNKRVTTYESYKKGSSLNGWKRYPIRKSTSGESAGDKMDSIFIPLTKGTEFTCKIRFHNLKKIEIGALLSAITFHNSESCFYQIGQGKPYGYGKVKINIVSNTLNQPIIDYMTEFESTLSMKFMKGEEKDWHLDDSIKELFIMANESNFEVNELLNYMKLEMNGVDEFSQAKSEKMYLERFSKLSKDGLNDTKLPTSLYLPFKETLKKAEEAKKIAEEQEKKAEEARIQQEIEAKKRIEAEEKLKIKEIKAQKAAQGFVFPSLEDLNSKDPWTDLKNKLKKYICDKYAKTNLDQVKRDFPNEVYINANQHDELIKLVTQIYHTFTPRDKKEWKNTELKIYIGKKHEHINF